MGEGDFELIEWGPPWIDTGVCIDALLSVVGPNSGGEISSGEPVETLSNTGNNSQHVDHNKTSAAVEPAPATVQHHTPATDVADTQSQGLSSFISTLE